MAFSPSDVVLVPFPFRDKAGEKARPAVVLSGSSYNSVGDLVIATITLHRARFQTDFELVDWQSAGLLTPSTVRMLIATVSADRVLHYVGTLSPADWVEVTARLTLVFA